MAAIAWLCACALTTLAAAQLNSEGLGQTRRHAQRTRRPEDIYDCMVSGEAYAAAYFMDRDVFEKNSAIPENFCSRGCNMESGSFSLFPSTRKSKSWKNDGLIKKTVDLFGFAVTHLSWLDRYMVNFKLTLNLKPWFVRHIHARVDGYEWPASSPYGRDDVQRAADDTLVIMPFFATPNAKSDSGHSSLGTRRAWLSFAFRGISYYFRHVTVCVGTDFDEAYARNESGLPFFDVHRVPSEKMAMRVRDVPDPGVPFKAGCMGLATLAMAKLRLAADPRYDRFRYVYYTESDQIPHVRNLGALLHALKSARDRGTYAMFSPHRLVPFFEDDEFDANATAIDAATRGLDAPAKRRVVEGVRRFLGLVKERHAPHPRMRVADLHHHRDGDPSGSCCFARKACDPERPDWVQAKEAPDRLPILRFPTAPFAVFGGEPDFHSQTYRPCTPSASARCPRDAPS